MTGDEFFPPSGMDWQEMARRLAANRSPRVRAEGLLRHTMLSQQLDAIKELLHRNQQAEAATRIKFEELDAEIEANPNNEQLDNVRDERFWAAVFMDSAHSMSAVGMLAPFVESLFVSIFAGLGERAQDKASDDPRAKATQNQYWNPQIVFGKDGPRTDFVMGVAQLAASTGLQPFLPDGYQKTLSALVGYRNNMFHNGFEWPLKARHNFANRIKKEDWPSDWFSQATSGDEPWVFYMSDDFIEHCLVMIDQVLDGVGRYLEQGGTGADLT